jgi:hypothetical protein
MSPLLLPYKLFIDFSKSVLKGIEKSEPQTENWSKPKATFKMVGVSLSMARTGHGEVFLL